MTAADKKTLSQKALKLSEETGELASAALPFDNAFATNHRFVTSAKILEEVADVMLVAMSIAFDLGYDADDIFSMMNRKAQVWARLQNGEQRYSDRNPYEIHITVSEPDGIDRYRAVCAELGVKPIVLDLQTRDNAIIKDVMTSSVFLGTNKGVHDEMERITAGLLAAGYNVVRKKIETVPWHPAAPSITRPGGEMPQGCYFECHMSVRMEDLESNRVVLKRLADDMNAHLSRNVFKRHEDGSISIMVTYRRYDGTSEEFVEEAGKIQGELVAAGFNTDKLITEFSVYDTNVHHDAMWTK